MLRWGEEELDSRDLREAETKDEMQKMNPVYSFHLLGGGGLKEGLPSLLRTSRTSLHHPSIPDSKMDPGPSQGTAQRALGCQAAKS